MEPAIENYDLSIKTENVKSLVKNSNKAMKSNKCNQCNYSSSEAINLRRHLEAHSGKSQTNANSVTLHIHGKAL